MKCTYPLLVMRFWFSCFMLSVFVLWSHQVGRHSCSNWLGEKKAFNDQLDSSAITVHCLGVKTCLLVTSERVCTLFFSFIVFKYSEQCKVGWLSLFLCCLFFCIFLYIFLKTVYLNLLLFNMTEVLRQLLMKASSFQPHQSKLLFFLL